MIAAMTVSTFTELSLSTLPVVEQEGGGGSSDKGRSEPLSLYSRRSRRRRRVEGRSGRRADQQATASNPPSNPCLGEVTLRLVWFGPYFNQTKQNYNKVGGSVVPTRQATCPLQPLDFSPFGLVPISPKQVVQVVIELLQDVSIAQPKESTYIVTILARKLNKTDRKGHFWRTSQMVTNL